MFGQSGAGNSDMILGRGMFDGTSIAGGNTYNDTVSVSSASGGGASGIGGNPTGFDLNEFPSLGGGGVNVSGSVGGVSSGDTSSFAAALRQQQQLLAQQQQQMIQGNKTLQSSSLHRLGLGPTNGTNFSMASEDFPALPGALNSNSTNIPLGSGGVVDGNAGGQRELSFHSSTSAFGSSTQQQQQLSINSATGTSHTMFGTNLESLSKHFDSTSLSATSISGHGSITGISSTTNPTVISHPPLRSSSAPINAMSTVGGSNGGGGGQGATSGATAAISGDFGLLGLLKVIRMTDADRNALALGSDLTALGLNLNSSETLYSHFASPWSDNPTTREPQYQLPLCYYMQPPALKTGHLSKFQLETLFYIFYAMPRDLLQAFAAQELYTREWRYHMELKLWFKRAGVADGIALSSSAVQYIYFDISTWERRLASGSMSQNIVAGLLSEDEVRVKFQSS